MSLRIIKQGLFDTIQDMGRYGYQRLGINPGGAMDNIAAAVANILVGNEMNDAIIETHFPAATIYFEKATIIAISGADFSASVNNEIVPLNTALVVAAGSTLSFIKYNKGARAYLAIQGGLSLEPWLNSYCTNSKAKAGGYHGRPLKKDDIIHCRAEQFAFASLPVSSVIVMPVTVKTEPLYNATNIIRCTEGKDFKTLQLSSQQAFTNASFIISRQSDRMGYCLTGDTLVCTDKSERISAAVTKGSIQLLPDGQLIILMADHQTTGGYPVVAHVASADIMALAQMQPGTAIQFSIITLEIAEQLYLQQQQYLQQLQDACNLQLKQFFS